MSDGTTQTTTQTGTPAAAAAAAQAAATTTQAQATGTTQQTTQQSTGTVLDDTSSTTQTTTPQNVGTWREDWRVAMAKGDDKIAKRLERYASPEAVTEALIAAQTKISSGQLKTPLPQNATAEQVKAWREENGIPETPDKYDLSLPGGVVLGDADKPIVEGFTKFAHDKNWTPDKVKEGLEWYSQFQTQQLEQRAEKDAQNRQNAEDELRAEWGAEFRINQRVLKESLDAVGLTEDLVGARGADGRLLLANPKIVRWLVSEAREKNPIASVLPGGGGNSMDALETELATLTKESGNTDGPYWKGPLADKKQARMRELLDAKERAKARAA